MKQSKQEPLISCIVPVYNAEKYLNRCVQSILNQSYSNIEIILINDGSTDRSAVMCDELASRYSKIKVLHGENSGASLARRKGLNYASGTFVTFVDSDDFISENFIFSLYEMLVKYKAQISACKVKRIVENEIVNEEDCSTNVEHILFNELLIRFFKYEFWGLCGKLYYKNVFDGVYFPKETVNEDYVVMTQLFFSYKNIIYTNQSLYFYEYHENSLSHIKLSKRSFEEFVNQEYVYNYVLEKGPLYAKYALSNVVETCVKLLLMKNDDRTHIYEKDFQKIKHFLNNNVFDIIKSKTLFKLKLVVIGLLLFPKLTYFYFNKNE